MKFNYLNICRDNENIHFLYRLLLYLTCNNKFLRLSTQKRYIHTFVQTFKADNKLVKLDAVSFALKTVKYFLILLIRFPRHNVYHSHGYGRLKNGTNSIREINSSIQTFKYGTEHMILA